MAVVREHFMAVKMIGVGLIVSRVFHEYSCPSTVSRVLINRVNNILQDGYLARTCLHDKKISKTLNATTMPGELEINISMFV